MGRKNSLLFLLMYFLVEVISNRSLIILSISSTILNFSLLQCQTVSSTTSRPLFYMIHLRQPHSKSGNRASYNDVHKQNDIIGNSTKTKKRVRVQHMDGLQVPKKIRRQMFIIFQQTNRHSDSKTATRTFNNCLIPTFQRSNELSLQGSNNNNIPTFNNCLNSKNVRNMVANS